MNMARIATPMLLLPALLAAPALAAGPGETRDADDPLLRRIADLEKEVATLRQEESTQWLTERRADEIRSLVADVLADADTRASFQQSGMTAGYDDGFFLASADGNFRLNVSGQLQARVVYNQQDNSPVDDNRWGFENARTKLWFDGHVFDSSWIYKIELNFDRGSDSTAGGSALLEDAYIGKALGDSGWALLAGQFKVPLTREELVYSAYQQAVERSLVGEEFSAFRTQGVAADFRNDWLHFTGGVTNGHPSTAGPNTSWQNYDTEISLTGRVEVKLGDEATWAQFESLPSFRGDPFGVLVGGAIHWQKGEFGTAADEIDALQWTVDASFAFGGANIFTYFVHRQLTSDSFDDIDDYGFVVQGGFFLDDTWELFGRYEWGDADGAAEDLSIITVGVNKYIDGHNVKWTTDVGFALNEVTTEWGDGRLVDGKRPRDITGWRTDSPDNDGQIVIRSQMQLLF